MNDTDAAIPQDAKVYPMIRNTSPRRMEKQECIDEMELIRSQLEMMRNDYNITPQMVNARRPRFQYSKIRAAYNMLKRNGNPDDSFDYYSLDKESMTADEFVKTADYTRARNEHERSVIFYREQMRRWKNEHPMEVYVFNLSNRFDTLRHRIMSSERRGEHDDP